MAQTDTTLWMFIKKHPLLLRLTVWLEPAKSAESKLYKNNLKVALKIFNPSFAQMSQGWRGLLETK